MSVDERLRAGLARNALDFAPDVEEFLASTLARRQRAQRIRRAAIGAGLAAAACLALILAVGNGWGDDVGAPAVPAASPTAAVAVAGRYVGQVAAIPTDPSAAGTWVLEFRAAGLITVAAPPAYSGAVTGVLFGVTGEVLRTDLFRQDRCAGLPEGRYRVTGTDGGMVLAAVDDACPQRVAVLASTPWTTIAAVAVPDGTWVRDVTTAEVSSRGLSLSPTQITDNYLDDGSVRVRLEMRGARWTLQVEDDAGKVTVGDLGENAYDADGRWVQLSDRTGAAASLAWELAGDVLTTSGLGSASDDERLFLEGAWQRER